MPGVDDADLRMTYCAFVVCALLDDWSCIDLPRAISYIHRCRVRTAPHPPPLYIPPHTDSARVVNRRTKADTDRHQMANHSADQHTAHSQRCTSHHKHNKVSSLQNGARRYAGSYRRKRQCSSGEALQDARTSCQMRVTGSGAVPRSPYAPLPYPSLPTYLTGP